MAVQSKLMSVPLELQLDIEDVLDMNSLLALGGTCTYFRDHVSATLKTEQDNIIKKYWPEPHVFLRILTWSHAIVTGEAALAFVARDPRVLAPELEVCVSRQYSYDLLDYLEQQMFVTRAGRWDSWPIRDERKPTAYLYRSPSNALIRVICSHTTSPFTPMTSAPTTALFNYFDKYSFGCAYRDLTINRRAIAPQLPFLSDDEKTRVQYIESNGEFALSQWSAAVAYPPVPFVLTDSLEAWTAAHEPEWHNGVCLRNRYQCPGQSRFFGDAGSLIEFFEPDMVDHAVMAHWHYAPYGVSAVWRLEGTACDYGCEGGDRRLREGTSETLLIEAPLRYGHFTTSVGGRIRIRESEWPRVWESLPDDIPLKNRGVLVVHHSW